MLVGLYVCHKIYCFVARVYIGMSRVRMLHVFPNLYLGLESQVDFADAPPRSEMLLMSDSHSEATIIAIFSSRFRKKSSRAQVDVMKRIMSGKKPMRWTSDYNSISGGFG